MTLVYFLMGLLGLLLGLISVRYVLFGIVWVITGHSFWLLPNLLSDEVGAGARRATGWCFGGRGEGGGRAGQGAGCWAGFKEGPLERRGGARWGPSGGAGGGPGGSAGREGAGWEGEPMNQTVRRRATTGEVCRAAVEASV